MSHAVEEMSRRGFLPKGVQIIPLPEALAKLTGSCTFHEASALQDSIQRLRQGEVSAGAFCLGLVNHWVAFLVSRVGSHWEFFLCDSVYDGGVPILDATDDELWQVIQERETETEVGGGG